MDLNFPVNAATATQMKLKSNVFSGSLGRPGQRQAMRDPGVPPVGGDQKPRTHRLSVRIFASGKAPSAVLAAKRVDSKFLSDAYAPFFRSLQQQIVQLAPA